MNPRTMLVLAIGASLALPLAADPAYPPAAPRPLAQAAVVDAPPQPRHGLVTVTGRVIEAGPDAFVLLQDEQRIRVRMDGWGWYRDDYRGLEGTLVTVQGPADGRWQRERVLRADVLYADDHGRVYYASGGRVADDVLSVRELVAPASSAFITGYVAEVAPNLIRVDSGNAAVDVVTDALERDPTRGEGPFELRVGDRIVAAGHLVEHATTRRNVGNRRLEATTLVLLTEDPRDADAVVLLPDDDGFEP